MNVFRLILRELVGMFVDDELLAVWILIVVAAAAALAFLLQATPLVTGLVLTVGCIGVLVWSCFKAAGRA
jgi:hypothetical protein